MTNLNPEFELVKNEGKANELILCSSANRVLLIDLKNELIKLHNRNKYIVRPIVIHIEPNKYN
jgi:hypothetical protein